MLLPPGLLGRLVVVPPPPPAVEGGTTGAGATGVGATGVGTTGVGAETTVRVAAGTMTRLRAAVARRTTWGVAR